MDIQDYRYLHTSSNEKLRDLECVLLKMDCNETRKTIYDCYVAYLLNGTKEMLDRGIFGIKKASDLNNYGEYIALDENHLNCLLEEMDKSIRRAIPECVIDYLFEKVSSDYFVLLLPAMSYELQPYTQKGADALLNTMLENIHKVERQASEAKLDEAEFFYRERLPSLYNDLCHARFNCLTLAK